jgi:hypothetical protein
MLAELAVMLRIAADTALTARTNISVITDMTRTFIITQLLFISDKESCQETSLAQAAR